VLDNINIEPNDVLLDIGFGNGYLIHKLLKNGIPIKICGIDISNDMVNNVSKKYKQFIDDGYLNLYLENIANTSFEKETYNKIYTVNTMYFWNELEKCFSEIKRILKPNGIFLNAVYTREFLDKIIYTKYGFNKYSIDDVIKITENNGMTIVKLVEIKKNNTYCVISKNAA
jgi:ubiquinone/menaquinone biosynthesis C-methylase UbiE